MPKISIKYHSNSNYNYEFFQALVLAQGICFYSYSKNKQLKVQVHEINMPKIRWFTIPKNTLILHARCQHKSEYFNNIVTVVGK